MKRKISILLTLFFIMLNCCVFATNTDNTDLQISSDTCILLDSKTGYVLFSKDAEKKVFPASTTKILTAIIALENCDLNKVVTVSKSAISAVPAGYSSAYLSEGEQISINDLITLFLVHSANDAGYILAEEISGNIDKFANLMNEKALELGCKDTHFTNPSGIHNNEHYTTAYDLALIAKYCMKNSSFRNIVSMQSCTTESTNKFGIRKYTNTNDLLNPSSRYYLKDCIGIKTGYTSQAKNCLVSACYKDDLELISVVLGANQSANGDSFRYIDSINLFDYGYSNFSYKSFAQKDTVLKTIEVKNGSRKTKNLDLILQDSLSGIIKNNYEIPEPTIVLNDNISAPIAQNTVIGTATYYIDGISYTQNLVASHNVEKNRFLLFIFIIILIFIVFLIIIMILFSKFMKKRKRKFKYSEFF